MWRRPSSRELIPSEVVAVATIGLFGLQGTRVAPRRPPPTARSPLPAVCLVVPSAIPLVPSVDQHPLPPVGQELSGASADRRATLAGAGLALRGRQSWPFGGGSSGHASPASALPLQLAGACVASGRRQMATAHCSPCRAAALGSGSTHDAHASALRSSPHVALRSCREQRLRVKAAPPRRQVFSQPTTASVLLFSQRSQ